MSLFGCVYDQSDTDALINKWGVGSAMFNDPTAGAVAADGEGVGRWVGDDGSSILSQTTPAAEPICDRDLFPGYAAMTVTADQRLVGTVTLPLSMGMVIVGGLTGSRVVLTIDTTATTTKPALALVLEEY